ncbi:MAG TPA: nucleotidyltransferase domain-containing protein, partial [Bacteroidota bacterium]|nr:nucleotidyltransferase domain-containing protein [Bacteroidota bacterium]
MLTDPHTLRSVLALRRGEIASAHRNGAAGIATCIALASVTDEAIRSACDALPPGTMDTIAILALGGYGRGELSPHSDIDVMVLCESGSLLEKAGYAARAVLHFLWDA